MNTSLWISRRLSLRGKGSSTAGVVIAVSGVALALIIMEFTLAIVVGFKDGIRNRLMGFDAQVTVCPADGRYLQATPELIESVRKRVPDADLRLALRQPALLKTDNDFEGLVFLAQSPDADYSFEKGNIVEGEWPDYASDSCDNKIVISVPTAKALGIGIGDKVYSTFFVDGNVKMRRHSIAALFQSNFGEYDRTVAYASLNGLQKVAGIDSISGNRLDIRGIDIDNISMTAERLQAGLVSDAAAGTLDSYYPVDSVLRTGALYFNWLSLLDTNVTVIFILILCVAGLTLVSSLFILILEHVTMIGVLRAMGASKMFVRNIFVGMAMRLVGLGMIIGNVLGIGLLLIQTHTHIVPLDPEMYYLNSVPVEIQPPAFVALNIGVAAVAWLILVLPARLAASIDPAKAVKYE